MTITVERTPRNTRSPFARIAPFLLAVCAILLPCLAQEPTGMIVGRIADASGSVAPDTAIEAMNVDTGVKWQVKSNQSGYFTIPLLPPGHYQVMARLEGFKPMTRTLTLQLEQVARLDFTLEIGAMTEMVEVVSAPSVLENGTASVGQVVQQQAVRDLPLNGRNYLDLAKLAMGIAEPSGAGIIGTGGDRAKNGGAFVANGVRSDMNNFIIDGVDNNAKIPDLSNNSNVVVQPSVDAIQEFKVETNNFSAEYGYSAGAVVNVTLKSGTNKFHGTAFEFLRNDQMDARDYFLLPTAKKAVLQRNQFGGVLGGPVIKNKTFFFGSWEGTRLNNGLTLVQTIPTDALKAGNFAGQKPIFDPNSLAPNPNGSGFIRTQFPNNAIPASLIDPRSAKLSALIPEPNASGSGNNYVVNPTQTYKRNSFDFRGDQNFSDKDKLFLRYSYYTLNNVNPGPFAAPLIGSAQAQQSNNDQSGHEAAIGQTHMFGPTLVNEFRAGYNRISNLLSPFVKDNVIQQFGFVNIPQQPGVTGLPNIVISGYANLGEAMTLPDIKGSDTTAISDNVLWTHGNHFIKAGGMYRWVRSRFDIFGQARGLFTFDGVFTQNPQSRGNSGNAYADFLLGIADNPTQLSNIFLGDMRYKYYGAFVNDDWKITPKLTVNLGVRYEIWTPVYERNDIQANFLIGANKLIYPNNKAPQQGIPASLITTIPSGLDSRGLVEEHKNNWSPRLGLAYQLAPNTVIRAGAGVFYAEPDALGANNRPVANPPFRINNAYPTDQLHPVITFASGFPANALNVQSVDPTTASFVGFAPDLKPAYIYHWSFGVQQQVGSFLLDANYVGTKGTHLSVNYDYNTAYAGGTPVASRRPVPGFGTITYETSGGNSEYNALQLRVERRYANGFTILGSYTYAKSIDLTGGGLVGDLHLRDVTNVFAERGLSSSDVRHRFVVSYIYDLPFGRGQRFNIGNPVLNAVAGNWQVNGITTVRTGQPFTPQLGSSSANTGDPRPNRIGNGNLPSDQRSVKHWFDTAAFTTPTQYNFGNAGRDIVFGPGAVNFDFSAFKRFPIKKLGETGELQFRAELFNIFNHPQFALPNARVDIPTGGTITSLVTPMRTVQLGAKVVF
jgi:Carboxypeptidase regulatory-like domain/TonB dependent receptor